MICDDILVMFLSHFSRVSGRFRYVLDEGTKTTLFFFKSNNEIPLFSCVLSSYIILICLSHRNTYEPLDTNKP